MLMLTTIGGAGSFPCTREVLTRKPVNATAWRTIIRPSSTSLAYRSVDRITLSP
jgi:hypothetical protein